MPLDIPPTQPKRGRTPSAPQVIFIHETLPKSLARDALSVTMLALMVAPGYLLGIPAMEWIGGLLFLFWVISVVTATQDRARMTTDEARGRLDQIDIAAGRAPPKRPPPPTGKPVKIRM